MIFFHLNNPFDNSKISHANFGKLAQTHIERLKANNSNNQFSSLINASDPLYTAYNKALLSESGTSSVKEGQTIGTNEAIKNIKSFISRKAGVIIDKFSKESPAYQEFFPLGLKEYNKASKKNIQLITERFIKACKNTAETVITDMAQEAQVLLDTYLSSRGTQLKSIGSVKTLSDEGKTYRDKLALQLYTNLLSLLLMHVADTDKVKAYYDESFIKKLKSKKTPAETIPSV